MVSVTDPYSSIQGFLDRIVTSYRGKYLNNLMQSILSRDAVACRQTEALPRFGGTCGLRLRVEEQVKQERDKKQAGSRSETSFRHISPCTLAGERDRPILVLSHRVRGSASMQLVLQARPMTCVINFGAFKSSYRNTFHSPLGIYR
jgi:hypothetical protein